ncbi:MAG: B12-binding domain-containing radical SAM protein [Clostridiales Family XIII bacterium]|jgi:radical SAM superfamily enzyme YgiQ (UPF0313 family)|nr:B12-binding domain-containing radical SAM protein [Clostridiales Family XIII bacterium]
MKIAVIKPSLFGERSKDALNPLLFAVLKPLTPPDVSLVFYDENTEEIPGDLACEAVAMTVDTFTARRAYVLSARFRSEGVKVIMGGYHPTLCSEEALRHADAVVIGEAEDTWGRVVADLADNALKPIYKSGNNADLARTRYDYSVFRGKKYHRIGFVQFSRGCKFSCDFCSIRAFHGTCVRTRPARAVAETIRGMPQKLFFFSDDNLFADTEQIDMLLNAIAPLKRHWACQISIDVAQNADRLKRMADSGCIMAIVGFESLNAENLRQMGKNANLRSDYEVAIQNIRAAGIMIFGTFVLGYDADTKDAAEEILRFALRHRFAVANFNPLIPTPGTALYGRLKSENRLLYEAWWNDPAYKYGDSAFVPRSMTPQELADSCKTARYRFYSLRNILRRMRGVNMRGLFHLSVFVLINLISRGEIRRKQGRRLGE